MKQLANSSSDASSSAKASSAMLISETKASKAANMSMIFCALLSDINTVNIQGLALCMLHGRFSFQFQHVGGSSTAQVINLILQLLINNKTDEEGRNNWGEKRTNLSVQKAPSCYAKCS